MEISKGLQEEILTVQNKLKIAIRDHQICVGKLKDDPNNTEILRRIQEIQLHIVTLGRCQKQVVQRLRKEVELFKAQNSNGVKVSIATLLGLNNNNHIMTNNKEKHNKVEGKTHWEMKSTKEHYKGNLRNGDVSYTIREDILSKPKLFINKPRPCSVETVSEDDDVIEISIDENSNEKQESGMVERKPEIERNDEKMNFLNGLGLITASKYVELQNKRAERKRRSTANPQFVYSNLEMPTKRKRYSYLQSGNAPQTRQSTARQNGPSPPLSKTVGQKSTSPPNRNTPLIPIQKATTRPNILRNTSESKINANKQKTDCSTQATKSVPLGINKTVHIPGLPSSLTIERIESDTIVCISCRNPGTLTVCEKCSSSYHLSCHTVSPAPGKTCPKCVHEAKNNAKKELEIAATTHAPGFDGKTGENSEIDQTSGGLYKIDAGQQKQQFPSTLGIGPLPISTLLIPISSNTNDGQSSERTSSTKDVENSTNINVPYPTVTFITTDPQPSYSYQLPINNVQPDQHQSYLIVKKITEPIGKNDGEEINNDRNVFLNSSNKKSNNIRALPALNRIIGNNYEIEQNLYRRPNKVRPIRPKIGNYNNNEFGTGGNEFLLPSYDHKSFQDDKLSEENNLSNLRPRQIRSRSASGLLHALFSGYNQPNIITGDPYESEIERIGSNFNNRYQNEQQQLEAPNNESGSTQRSRRSALTKFFDHVKLEEAHLSAPLGTKLENEGNDGMTSFVLRDFVDSTSSGANENTSWVPGRIISRKTRKSDSVLEVLQRNSNELLKPTLDIFHLEKNHTFSRLCSDENNHANCVKDNGQFVEKKVALLKRCKSSGGVLEDTEYCVKENFAFPNYGNRKGGMAFLNFIKSHEENNEGSIGKGNNIYLVNHDDGTVEPQGEEYLLKNDTIVRNVSVPDDEAETERQDLIGGRRSMSDNKTDIPERTIKETNTNIYEEIKERLYINTVSSESMQVLEQFESAMLDVDRVESATH